MDDDDDDEDEHEESFQVAAHLALKTSLTFNTQMNERRNEKMAIHVRIYNKAQFLVAISLGLW